GDARRRAPEAGGDRGAAHRAQAGLLHGPRAVAVRRGSGGGEEPLPLPPVLPALESEDDLRAHPRPDGSRRRPRAPVRRPGASARRGTGLASGGSTSPPARRLTFQVSTIETRTVSSAATSSSSSSMTSRAKRTKSDSVMMPTRRSLSSTGKQPI